MAFRGSPTSAFLLEQDPSALRPKSPEEVGILGGTIQGPQGKRRRTDNCDRLIALYVDKIFAVANILSAVIFGDTNYKLEQQEKEACKMSVNQQVWVMSLSQLS